MKKQFCDRCGKPTLMRTSCSTDKNGTFRVHLKKNMQWNNRGNVYSIPKPVIGAYDGKLSSRRGNVTWGEGLLLAEDQKEYMRAVAGEKKKKETDLIEIEQAVDRKLGLGELLIPGERGADRTAFPNCLCWRWSL